MSAKACKHRLERNLVGISAVALPSDPEAFVARDPGGHRRHSGIKPPENWKVHGRLIKARNQNGQLQSNRSVIGCR